MNTKQFFSLIHKTKAFLLREYLVFNSWKQIVILITALYVSLFAFLTYFQPFGLRNFSEHLRYELIFKYITYPLLIWAVCVVAGRILFKKTFTILRSLIMLVLLIIIAGFTSHFVWAQHFNYPFFRWGIFMDFLLMGFSAVFLPALIIIVLHSNYFLHKRLKQSIQQKPSIYEPATEKVAPIQLILTSQEQNKSYSFVPDQIQFIQSQDNYIKIHLHSTNNKNYQLIRTTLSKSLSEIEQKCTHIVRCHNSYIVNLNMVVKVDGNSAGYKLSLRNCDSIIPVSRKYLPTVQALLKTNGISLV